MKKLRKIVLIFNIILMLIMCGCIHNQISDEEEAEKLVVQVFEYIKNEDAEGLKSLFSKNVSESYDLDEEIKGLFEFFDGNVISYEKFSTGSSSEKVDYGKQVYLTVAPVIRNVETDTGKIYKIGFFSYIICEEDEDNVGIETLKVMDEDEIIYYVGEK